MKTFAKIGQGALTHLFLKKEVFKKTTSEELKMVAQLPKKVSISKELINLEDLYISELRIALLEETFYKIYIWDIELGLIETELDNKNQRNLITLICRTQKVPSHVVIAKKKYFDRFEFDEFESYSQEEIIIYSCSENQKKLITNCIKTSQLLSK
ncbi:MAG: hypothetical protein WC264_03150 [Candidatus Paceibacterota bacterium]|jgi:hypothetical protein